MPIYTKNGDKGKSTTVTAKKLSKAAKVFEVLGTLDELSASLGMLHASKKVELKKIVQAIQSDLFIIGAYLAGKKPTKDELTKLELRVVEIEKHIDKIDKLNKPLKNFILPGGLQESSHLHLARAISRRLERVYTTYMVVPNAVKFPVLEMYFNRLSDYLFVLARYYNDKGRNDIVWNNN